MGRPDWGGREAVRRALEPAYGRPLDDGEAEVATDNLRRFYELLIDWDRQDRLARAAREGGDGA